MHWLTRKIRSFPHISEKLGIYPWTNQALVMTVHKFGIDQPERGEIMSVYGYLKSNNIFVTQERLRTAGHRVDGEWI